MIHRSIHSAVNFLACLSILLTFGVSQTAAQVILNEAAAINNNYENSAGETPDWIELRNMNSLSANLNGWTITDDITDPTKASLNNLVVEGNGYSILWATGETQGFTVARSLVQLGDSWKYIVPNQPLNSDWNELTISDDNWNNGNTGMGYGDNDDSTILPAGTRSVFMRKKFAIEDKSNLAKVIMDIDYDDGFVAYINGVEFARANMSANNPTYNASAITDREALVYQGGPLEKFELFDLDIINEGENVLAIQLHNVSANSSDMSILPYLTGLYYENTEDGDVLSDELSYNPSGLNFKISSEGETLYLFDASQELVDSLQIGFTKSGVSCGKDLEGEETFYFAEPTPMSPNFTVQYEGVVQNKVTFSHQGGPSTTNVNLILGGADPGDFIRFTSDGSEPTLSSTQFQFPLFINNTTIVRAQISRENFIPSDIESRAYLYNIDHDISIVNMVVNHDDFFDPVDGMYVLGAGYSGDYPYFGSNIWEDWERPASISLFDSDGDLEINFNAGVKIFGGWSRANDQRSLSIFARNAYGNSSIDFPIFPQTSDTSFQALVLRNSGNDWLRSNLRDRTLTSLMYGEIVDLQYARPVATYINGSYWGLYNIREKVNEHFLARKHGIDPDNIDILEFDGQTVHGNNMDYQSLIQYVETNNLANDNAFQIVASQIDLENLAAYYAAQIYFDNQDWPGNNIKFWKATNGKWKWILYDTDFGFGIWNPGNVTNNTLTFATQANGPTWPNPPWSTLLFRKLLANTEFRNIFVNRLADQLNTRFLPSVVTDRIDEVSDELMAEMPLQFNRWNGDINFGNLNVSQMINFGSSRPTYLKVHVLNTFNLDGFHTVSISNQANNRGFVELNSLTIDQNLWQGDYYEDVPIRLKAIPKPGYIFDHWEGDVDSQDAEIFVNMNSNKIITPIFATFSAAPSKLIINEINYDSNAGDWIEIYNPNPFSVSAAGYELKDNDDTHSFILPDQINIDGEGFLIVTKNLQDFKTIHPDVDALSSSFDFGLSSAEDAVRLYDQNGVLVDIVEYTNSNPWPETANATGMTIELKEPYLDNSLGENWKSINPVGSPGDINKPLVALDETASDQLEIMIYPNPFYDQLVLSTSSNHTIEDLILHTADGQKVNKNQFHMADQGDLLILYSNTLISGLYFAELRFTDGSRSTVKLIKN